MGRSGEQESGRGSNGKREVVREGGEREGLGEVRRREPKWEEAGGELMRGEGSHIKGI